MFNPRHCAEWVHILTPSYALHLLNHISHRLDIYYLRSGPWSLGCTSPDDNLTPPLCSNDRLINISHLSSPDTTLGLYIWQPQQHLASPAGGHVSNNERKCQGYSCAHEDDQRFLPPPHTHTFCQSFLLYTTWEGREIIKFSFKVKRWWQLREETSIKTKIKPQGCKYAWLFIFFASISCHRSSWFIRAATLSTVSGTHESNLGHLIDSSLPSP